MSEAAHPIAIAGHEVCTTPPTAQAFKALYDTTGWGPVSRSADYYASALTGSWCTRSVYDGARLVGFGRVISDGRLHAFITEMIVHPDFQRRGIGARLLAALLEACHEAGITDIQLFSAHSKSAFYTRHGFSPRPEAAPGMQFIATTVA